MFTFNKGNLVIDGEEQPPSNKENNNIQDNKSYSEMITELPKKVENLTRKEKLSIVEQYHNITHSYKKNVRNLLIHTGQFKWSDLDELIEEVDQKCLLCELVNIEKHGYHPAKSISAEFAGDVWVIDYIQLPRSDTKFLLHVLDLYSGYNILRPVEHKSGLHTAQALYNIMCEHGYPQRIIHDRGNEFVNTHTNEMLEALSGILVKSGSPYHPQTQGANERRHFDIRKLIIEQINKYVDKWEDAIPTVQMKMNLRITRRHKSTPFAVYFGRTHNVFNISHTNNVKDESTWLQRLDKLEHHVHPALKRNIQVYDNQRVRYSNKERAGRLTAFSPGDWVKMANLNSAGDKLDATYKGPYIIQDRVPGGYDLIDVNSETGGKVNALPVPVEQLIAWGRKDMFQNKYSDDESFQTQDYRSILSHRKNPSTGTFEYQILWSDGTSTWESDDFATDMSAINAYKKRNARRAFKGAKKRRLGSSVV
eukprot:Pgem_evm2s19626